jgi:hypothetical protein
MGLFDDVSRWMQRDWLMAELDNDAPEDPGTGADAKRRKKADPGTVVVATALAEWERVVREPRGEANRVDEYIRGDLGLGWSTADAINWTPNAPYTRNGMFQWCGAFAAFCWGTAGLRADPVRKKSWASTVRLYKWAQGSERVVSVPDGLLPGDVVIVTRGKKKQGEHICLVERVDLDAKLVHTIEGNARGRGGDGEVFEGVIRRTRPWPKALGGWGRRGKMRCPVSGLSQSSDIVWAYRPLAEDLV